MSSILVVVSLFDVFSVIMYSIVILKVKVDQMKNEQVKICWILLIQGFHVKRINLVHLQPMSKRQRLRVPGLNWP